MLVSRDSMSAVARIVFIGLLLPACSVIDALGGGGDDDDSRCPEDVCYDFADTYSASGATHVAVGPFDERGAIDLATVDGDADVIFFFDDETAGDPGRAFIEDTGFSFPAGSVTDLASGDVDDDGMFELLGGRIDVDGTTFLVDQIGFGMSARTAGIAGTPTQLVADDFDGDGFHDVAVASGTDVIVLFGTANGFDSTFETLTVGFSINGLARGEFDGSNGPDIAVMTTIPDNQIQLFFNNGAGTFQAGTPFRPCLDACPGGGTETEDTLLMAAGDFEQNGIDDLVVLVSCRSSCSSQYDELRFLLGDGGGDFSRHSELDMTGFGTTVLTTGQLDDDGSVDIAWQNNEDVGTLKLLHGNYFTGDGEYTTLEQDGSPIEMLVHDLNLDGLGDIITLRDGHLDVTLSQR